MLGLRCRASPVFPTSFPHIARLSRSHSSCAGSMVARASPSAEHTARLLDRQETPSAVGRPAASPVVVRPYSPDRDHADVAVICRNVYGGTDDLPATINASAAEPGTHILVAAAGADAPVDALLCCQQRGDVLWLWGARTREECRGRGLARLLVAEAEALARRLPGVVAMLSVTVPANATMCRLFAGRGFRQQAHILSWPATAVAHAVTQRLALPAPGVSTFLEAQPRVASIVDAPAARRLRARWRRCLSADEVAPVLQRLRRQRTDGEAACLASRSQGRLSPTSHAYAWLPAEYAVVPAAWPSIERLAARGCVWVLDEAQPAAAAVMVFWGPGFRAVRHAGLVAGGVDALHAALLHAAAVDPRCSRFYVDCCGFRHEQLFSSTGGERFDILPFYKPLLA